MNRMQIALKLGMGILGIPVTSRNYQRICDAVYLAEENGVYISPATIDFDPETGRAYSPPSNHAPQEGWRSLYDDVCEIEGELDSRVDDSEGWVVDDASVLKLEEIAESLAD